MSLEEDQGDIERFIGWELDDEFIILDEEPDDKS
jgi:hypothetical protein